MFRKNATSSEPSKATAAAPSSGGSAGSTTLIAAGTKISGNLEFSGHLEIEGVICGNITSSGKSEALVRIMREGRVEGEINVSSMVINGTVVGNVYCSDNLVLAQNANITGDLHYSAIEMAKGAHVNGNLVYTENQPATKASSQKPTPAGKPAQA